MYWLGSDWMVDIWYTRLWEQIWWRQVLGYLTFPHVLVCLSKDVCQSVTYWCTHHTWNVLWCLCLSPLFVDCCFSSPWTGATGQEWHTSKSRIKEGHRNVEVWVTTYLFFIFSSKLNKGCIIGKSGWLSVNTSVKLERKYSMSIKFTNAYIRNFGWYENVYSIAFSCCLQTLS